MGDIISVQDLNLWYGNHQALHHINMEIPEKSITAFIGPSGCGKSTLLKTLNSMNDLVKGVRITGNVFYLGQDIYAPEVEVSELRRQIGMVFQKPNPFPMSIYDNVAYGPRTHGIRKKAELDEIVERSLRDAAIWDEVKDRLRKNALGLSGGQQQRLCIARALAVEPNVLLMDEPFGALDALTRQNMQTLIREIWNKTGNTIFMITHDVDEALALATRVIVMSSRPGRIVKEFHTDFTYDIVGTNQESAKYTQEYMHIREEILSIINTQNAALTADAI